MAWSRSAASQSSERGFTMLEAVVALALIAIAMLALAGLVGVAISGNFDSSQYTVANDLVVDKIEQIRDLAYSSVSSGVEAYGSISGHSEYQRTVTVVEDEAASTGPPPVYGQKTVTVTVEWQRTKGRTAGSISMNTVVVGIS
jgi:prepilin-type N-terminal cleavage/methylation domain-containing protein